MAVDAASHASAASYATKASGPSLTEAGSLVRPRLEASTAHTSAAELCECTDDSEAEDANRSNAQCGTFVALFCNPWSCRLLHACKCTSHRILQPYVL